MSSNLEIEMTREIMVSPVDFEEFDDVQVNEVIGYIQMGNLKFTLDLNLIDFYTDAEITPTELEILANKNLKFKLYEYPSGVSVAYITWYFNAEINYIEPYFVFSDGSEEEAINYLPEALHEIFYFEEDSNVDL